MVEKTMQPLELTEMIPAEVVVMHSSNLKLSLRRRDSNQLDSRSETVI